MKKIIIFIFYSFFLLLIGRNLPFLPQITLPERSLSSDPLTIREQVLSYLQTVDGDYSIYFENLNNGESFGIGQNTVLTAASLNKLYIIGYLYSLAGKGEIDLEDTIVIQEQDIQNYGTGSLRYEEPGKSYTLKTLARLALKQSDNTAAHVLLIRLGEENVGEYARQINSIATNIPANKTSPRDVGNFFKLLYSNQITTEPLTLELLEFLKDTEFEDRVPLFLPENVSVHHKIGDAVAMVHDGGIINNSKNPFILVIMSSNINDEKKAKETIGHIAKLIFDKVSSN